MSTRLSTRDSGTALNLVKATTDKITVTNVAGQVYNNTDFTIVARIKLVAYDTQYIFSHPESAGNGNRVYLSIATSGRISVVLGVGGITTTPTQALQLNKWYTLVARYRRADAFVQLTVNDVEYIPYTQSTALTPTSTLQSLYIGNQSAASVQSLGGSLDEIHCFQRLLTTQEATDYYYSGILPSTPVLSYLLNEGVGTTALDTSGNANHGTITGATYTTDVPFKPRVATTNRTAVQPMNASLNFSVSTDKVDCGTAITGLNTTASFSVWFKPFKNGSTQTIFSNVVSASNRIGLIIHSNGELSAGFYNGSSYTGKVSSVFRVDDTMWRFVSITWDGSTMTMRINGVVAAGANQPILQSTAGIVIGLDTAGTSPYKGKLKDLKIFNRILTTTEQDALMSGINPTDYSTSIVRDFSLNEGAGTTVYSKNNTSLTGTITGATWSSNTPTKTRNQVGGNLVKNGDLSYIPQVNVAQTGTPGWVDGTVGGNSSTTNNNFNWAGILDATACSVLFDTTTLTPTNKTSFKIEATNATGRGRFIAGSGLGSTAASISLANLNLNPIFVLPSTSYTVSYYMKTLTCKANTGITYHLHNGVGTRTSLTNADVTSGTTDWTLRTATFTTGATDRYIVISAGINTAGSTQTCWIGDITLTPTVNTTRVAV